MVIEVVSENLSDIICLCFINLDLSKILKPELKSFILCENEHKVIETVPGWIHTIKNIGKDTVFGIIWANEEFKINKSDTYYVQE